MTSDPTPDRHREARAALRRLTDAVMDERSDAEVRSAATDYVTALSPAGPEKPREELRDCGCRHVGPCRESECGHHEWQDLATTPVPDSGAEERLRAALRAGVEAMRFPDATYVERAAVLRLIDTALSGGSVDEEARNG